MRRLLAAALLAAAPLAGAGQPAGTEITFSVEAETRVANDRVVAVLFKEREAPSAAAAARAVNEALTWGLGQVRAVAAVEASTGEYHTRPIYRERRIEGWRVRQSLRLESGDAQVLAELIGRLQERLALASLTSVLSSGARLRAENELIDQVIDTFRARAERIAARLGRDYRITRLEIGRPPVRPPQPVVRALAATSEGVAPAIEPGTSTVRVSARGAIELAAE